MSDRFAEVRSRISAAENILLATHLKPDGDENDAADDSRLAREVRAGFSSDINAAKADDEGQ